MGQATIDYRPRDMALTLMKSALDLLDAAGEATAAIHLSRAIEMVEAAEPPAAAAEHGRPVAPDEARR